MIYLVNIFTIILAVVFAIQLANENKAYLYSVISILTGISMHVLEAYLSVSRGKCGVLNISTIVENIDDCISYESASMLFAQAAILAGFTVLFVKLAIRYRVQSG